ncbi:hypothetical protein AVEN_268455-1 [Araneus ventricosus]|uniref:Uncharacterized protein n=1 Tax=Araneus ventricosus TaxID=182803 RepID=A0A4Y2STX6_ARAVE|nr:hypothetical protein AVEN_268455-1 [Araneus ventricosus]
MERYGYLIVESSGTYIYHTHSVLFTDIVSCVKSAIEQKIDGENTIWYFQILKNSDIIKYLHDAKKDQSYSFTYLHQPTPSDPYYICCGARKLYKDLLQCIIDVKSSDRKIPDILGHLLKIGYLKILTVDELLLDLHIPI